MKKIIYTLAAVFTAALLAGALWYFVNSGAYRDFNWRLLVI